MDGDTDNSAVQREFERIVRQNAQTVTDRQALAQLGAIQHIGKLYTSERRQPGRSAGDLTVHDLEDVPPPGVVPTISHHISLVNGGVGTKAGAAGAAAATTTTLSNGVRPSFRNMLDEANDAHVDSYM